VIDNVESLRMVAREMLDKINTKPRIDIIKEEMIALQS